MIISLVTEIALLLFIIRNTLLFLLLATTQSAEQGTCTHKKICCRSKCTPKIGPCMLALYAYKLNIDSPGVSYYLKCLGAPKRIKYAPHAPLIFYLACARSRRVLPCSADWATTTIFPRIGPLLQKMDQWYGWGGRGRSTNP